MLEDVFVASLLSNFFSHFHGSARLLKGCRHVIAFLMSVAAMHGLFNCREVNIARQAG